jgi:hypothetical protein
MWAPQATAIVRRAGAASLPNVAVIKDIVPARAAKSLPIYDSKPSNREAVDNPHPSHR